MRHSGTSGCRAGQTDRRTRGHPSHRKLRDPIRPRCWTHANRTATAHASRHERRSDIPWRHALQAFYGHSGRFSFYFTIRTADADRRRQRNFITWRGPEQHATRKGPAGTWTASTELRRMAATDGGGRASRVGGLGGDDVLSGLHCSGRGPPCTLRVLMRLDDEWPVKYQLSYFFVLRHFARLPVTTCHFLHLKEQIPFIPRLTTCAGTAAIQFVA